MGRLGLRGEAVVAPGVAVAGACAALIAPPAYASAPAVNAPGWWLPLVLLALSLMALSYWRYRKRTQETERVRARLEHSEELLKHALWGSGAELWESDIRTGALIRHNRLEHLAVTHDANNDTLQDYTPFVHPDDQDAFRAALRACVKGESDLFECSYRTPDLQGDMRWMLSRGRVFERDAQGRALRLVGTTFDITALRDSEAQLRESEERLKLALWGSGDEMWDIDLQSGSIRRENALAVTALDSELRFPHLVDYLQFVHPDDRDPLRDALIDHMKGAVDHFACSYRVRHCEEGWVWILGKGRVVGRTAEGRALRMVGTNRDVTSLKRAEEALRSLNEELEVRVQRRTEALERANSELQQTLDQLTQTQRQLVESEKLAALGGLVAGVAHEINTPLGVGVTAASHLQVETQAMLKKLQAQTMSRGDLDQFLDQARLSSDLVLTNLERASQLVRSFKQVAVDQSSEQRREFKLGEYLREILLSLNPRIRKSQVRVVILCPEDLVLDTYPGALYQIVVNLVINSLVHAFAEDSTDARIGIAAEPDGENIVIDYHDNGCGMSEAVRKRVFEPFFTTRRGSGGSGLGLHIVYNLCTQVLRGSVHCDSTQNQGTHFRLIIPRVAPAPPARPEPR